MDIASRSTPMRSTPTDLIAMNSISWPFHRTTDRSGPSTVSELSRLESTSETGQNHSFSAGIWEILVKIHPFTAHSFFVSRRPSVRKSSAFIRMHAGLCALPTLHNAILVYCLSPWSFQISCSLSAFGTRVGSNRPMYADLGLDMLLPGICSQSARHLWGSFSVFPATSQLNNQCTDNSNMPFYNYIKYILIYRNTAVECGVLRSIFHQTHCVNKMSGTM